MYNHAKNWDFCGKHGKFSSFCVSGTRVTSSSNHKKIPNFWSRAAFNLRSFLNVIFLQALGENGHFFSGSSLLKFLCKYRRSKITWYDHHVIQTIRFEFTAILWTSYLLNVYSVIYTFHSKRACVKIWDHCQTYQNILWKRSVVLMIDVRMCW